MINGRYQLHQKIGQGGMGIVHLATDRLSGETVALKQVFLPLEQLMFNSRPASQTKRELRLALAREFQILAGLRHPNIISVLDYGFDENGQPFFAMSSLENAQTIVAAANGRSLPEKINLLIQMLQALAYLHRRGILHRDLKPDNVLVVGDTVRVLDFGLAAAKEQATDSVGSWLYMAPELLLGQPASEASDLYAVGVLAYQLFTNEHPFNIYAEDSVGEILEQEPDWQKIQTDDNTTGTSPTVLPTVVRTLLAKKPAQRYPSAQAAIAALSQVLGQNRPAESQSIRESYLQAAAFVGREAELAQLTEALKQVKAGNGSAWLVEGESGVGKSRLLDEVRTQALVQGALVLTGQAVENRSGSPYQLWRDVVRRLVLSTELDDWAVSVLQTVVPDMGRLLERPVLDIPDLGGQAGQQRLFSTIVQLFRQQQQWVCLFLEDLHWSDQGLDILQQLTRLQAEMPLLIIGSYRNDERPDLPALLPDLNVLQLERLSTAEITELSTAILGAAGTRPEMLDLLQRETEGNTFFLVEVVRDLAEQAGRLSAVSQMELPDRLFPQGIESLIRRRLARVPEAVKRLLPGVAVAGRQLDLAVVRQLAGQIGLAMPLVDWLTVCAETAVLDIYDGNWRFAHDKLREGLLGTLQAGERSHWHSEVAAAIEHVYPNDPEQAAVLTNHWREAGNSNKERRYALLAGQYAQRQFSNREAIAYLDRALILTPADDLPSRYDILRAQEQIHSLLGEREVQRQELAALKEVAEALAASGGVDHRAAVALRQGNYAEVTGDYEAAVTAAQEAIRLAWLTQAGRDEAAGYLSWGRALLRQGKYEEATAKFSQALAQAQASKLQQIEADSLRFLGVAAMESGKMETAVNDYTRALSLYEQLEDRQGESTALNNLGNLYQAMGDSTTAQSFWERAQRIYGEIGDREGNGRILINLSATYMDVGDYPTARAYSEQALSICREIGVRFGECFALLNLGIIYHYLANNVSAEMYSRHALQLAENMGVPPLQGNALMVLGHALTGQKNYVGAIEAYEHALGIWQAMNQQMSMMEIEAGLARVAMAKNEPTEALAHVNKIVAYLDAGHSLEGAEQPFRIYLTCYDVLVQEYDPKAEELLARAHTLLQQYAARITDPARKLSYLTNIPAHRELIELFQQQN
ncbi:MAG: DUF2791 family P-loop domain-containing protein [Anaerolineales bacterium]|nr:DUF2791 family P-loop domain-containing protein [Anaerolineales bacterium]